TPDEVIRSLSAGEAPARPSERSAPSASPAAKAGEPSFEAPRGAPRAALAAARPAPLPVAPVPALAAPAPAPITPVEVDRFEDLIALAGQRRDLTMKTALERDVRLVRFEDGRLEIAIENGASKTLVNDLSRKLAEWTGRRWMIVVSAEQGAPTVKAQVAARKAELERGVRADPLVQAVLARLPGAEIGEVRRRDQDAATAALIGDDPEDVIEPPVDDEASVFGAHGAPGAPDGDD